MPAVRSFNLGYIGELVNVAAEVVRSQRPCSVAHILGGDVFAILLTILSKAEEHNAAQKTQVFG